MTFDADTAHCDLIRDMQFVIQNNLRSLLETVAEYIPDDGKAFMAGVTTGAGYKLAIGAIVDDNVEAVQVTYTKAAEGGTKTEVNACPELECAEVVPIASLNPYVVTLPLCYGCMLDVLWSLPDLIGAVEQEINGTGETLDKQNLQ